MKFGQFLSYYKRIKFIKKLYKNWELKTSSTPLLCLKRSKPNFFWKMKFFKPAPYIRYVIAKLSKFIQFDIPASWDSFLQMILWKLKRAWNEFPGLTFGRMFWYIYIFLQYYINWPNFITRLCLLSSYSGKFVLCFMLGHLMTSWHLNI